MLRIEIPKSEIWDEENEEFIELKSQILTLEHSLVSISKWESKWKKPLLEEMTNKSITKEGLLDYFRCMTLTQNVDPRLYYAINKVTQDRIMSYINDGMTATTFSEVDGPKRKSTQIITSELVYYWMTAYRIPFEVQKWHFNRLMTLIRICNIKNQEPKKMSKNQLKSRNRALNAARRKKLGTTG